MLKLTLNNLSFQIKNFLYIKAKEMEEKFDYVILSEANEWLSTGVQVTQKELNDDLEQLKAENPDVELVVYKAKNLETFTY